MKKNRRRQPHSPSRAIEAKDAVLQSCEDITTLAELLGAAGSGLATPLATETVIRAGGMIAREANRVRQWIDLADAGA